MRSKKTPLDKLYDKDLKVTAEYIETLPDLQNGPSSLIEGAQVPIQQVGISNFKIPLNFIRKDGNVVTLKTSITGTVSLSAQEKGINMSRIVRSFYEYKGEVFSITILRKVLDSYKKNLNTFDANIVLNFSYPILQKSLRSNLEGWQYYDVALVEKLNKNGDYKTYIHFDFVYSSACPCSFELGQHAMEGRCKAVVPHSQRSIARISIECSSFIWIEDIKDMCVDALKTETQVMVKREDEQAFAELNGSYQKFVEDACRLLYAKFNSHEAVSDFRISCLHMESLHSHSAVGIIVKGVPGGFSSDIDMDLFKMLEVRHIF